MIDSHCHLDLPAFDADRTQVLDRAAGVGLRGIVIPAIRPATWARLREVCAGPSPVALRAAIGVHPQVVPDLDPDERAIATDPARLAAAAAAAGAVAIGECGLDGGTGERPLQEEILRAHLRAARELGLPLVLHVLRAHDGAAAILRAEGVAAVGGIMHSYSGGAGLVPTYLALGLGISFAGAVTWPGARRPIEAARVVPDDHLMVETDAPDQTPAPHRGARCEPAHLAATVHALALVRGVDAEVVAAFTEANARRILGW